MPPWHLFLFRVHCGFSILSEEQSFPFFVPDGRYILISHAKASSILIFSISRAWCHYVICCFNRDWIIHRAGAFSSSRLSLWFFSAGLITLPRIFDMNVCSMVTGFIFGISVIIGWGVSPCLPEALVTTLSFR